jgi:two-component system response regulator AtoC
MEARRILVVDDDATTRLVLESGLSGRGFDVKVAGSVKEALAAIASEPIDALVTDLNMRSDSGLELVRALSATRPEVPSIVITAFGSLDTAIGAIRAGAYDYLTKPFELDELCLALDRALDLLALRKEVRQLRDRVAAQESWPELIGSSPAMKKLTQLLNKVAASTATILIHGETGTGKEVVAQSLHRHGPRKDGPFLAINCAAMPEALLESELFGHVRGAFTDAKADRRGLFEQAEGGTLFLDEVGELPAGLQPKILRVLQERRVRPIGASAERPFDARIVAATNRDLEKAVEERVFREDLYFRLAVISIELPPLRERGSDALELAHHFIRKFSKATGRAVEGLSPEAARKLVAYAWPGNVRELENAMERAVTLTEHSALSVADLPDRIQSHRADPAPALPVAGEEIMTLAEIEKRHIMHVVASVGGHRSRAAQILGLDRKTLYRKLERYGVEAGPEE